MPARAHQLHQPSRSADRELGSRRQARGRRAFVRTLDPPEGSNLDAPLPPTARSGRPRRARRAGRPARSPRRPARRPNPAPPPPPPTAPPTGSPPSSRPRTACSPSASAARGVRRPGPHHRRDPRPRRRRPGRRPAVDLALDALADPRTSMPYVTGFETADGPRRQRRRQDPARSSEIAGVDVERRPTTSRPTSAALMETDGDDAGRFSDTDSLASATSPTASARPSPSSPSTARRRGVPTAAVDYLLDQQCSDGSFRLYQFGYALSFDPPVTVDTHTCDDPAEGDPDATAFALHGPARGAVDARGRRRDRRRGRPPARPAAVLGRLLRHRRGEHQHDRPGRRRAARGR